MIYIQFYIQFNIDKYHDMLMNSKYHSSHYIEVYGNLKYGVGLKLVLPSH